MSYTNEEILSKFQEIVADALSVDISEVVPEARVFSDLAAESIDILDIQFRIEDEFGLKINRDDFGERLAEGLGEEPTAQDIDARFTIGWCVDFICEELQAAEKVEE
ncbi:MAG: hypothetical protein JSV45_14725 [Chromatiales bacterium]|nr:MAG: hypothetical protein JSV45_14725 [Chromatiales bacterium]